MRLARSRIGCGDGGDGHSVGHCISEASVRRKDVLLDWDALLKWTIGMVCEQLNYFQLKNGDPGNNIMRMMMR